MNEDEKRKGEMIGKILQSLRIKLNMTLRDVEKVTGISNSYLSQIERGLRGIPNITTLSKLAETYGTTYIDIISPAFRSVALIKLLESYTPGATYIAREYEKLSKTNKKTLYKFINFLIQQEKNHNKLNLEWN